MLRFMIQTGPIVCAAAHAGQRLKQGSTGKEEVEEIKEI